MLAPDARPARGAIPGFAMSGGATSTSERAELAESGGGLSTPRRGRRRWVTVAVVLMLVAIAAAALALVRGVFEGRGGSSSSGGNGSATSLATVQRRTLSQT